MVKVEKYTTKSKGGSYRETQEDLVPRARIYVLALFFVEYFVIGQKQRMYRHKAVRSHFRAKSSHIRPCYCHKSLLYNDLRQMERVWRKLVRFGFVGIWPEYRQQGPVLSLES